MPKYTMPPQDIEILKRIRLVRRDISNRLFHFTRSAVDSENGKKYSAREVLVNILKADLLFGTGTWTGGEKCVCFTEAPMAEFASIFSLVEIASKDEEKPRYEPYGIAVTKDWLFAKGGRPVIYDDGKNLDDWPESQRYRYALYNPQSGIDYTWEREWRVKTDRLTLDPRQALVVVPTIDEAFDVMDSFLLQPTGGGSTGGHDLNQTWKVPKWKAVSLDLYGLRLL